MTRDESWRLTEILVHNSKEGLQVSVNYISSSAIGQKLIYPSFGKFVPSHSCYFAGFFFLLSLQLLLHVKMKGPLRC